MVSPLVSPTLSPHPCRQLWRLLLRRAQEALGRGGSAAGDDPNTAAARQAETAAAADLLSRGMIPLPLLDQVAGFDADEALRVRRQLQQLEAVSTFFCGETGLPRTIHGEASHRTSVLVQQTE